MAFLKVAMLKLLFEFDVVTFAQEIMSVQGQLTLSTYDVRLTFESGVISTSYQYVHLRQDWTSGLDVRWTLVIGYMTS